MTPDTWTQLGVTTVTGLLAFLAVKYALIYGHKPTLWDKPRKEDDLSNPWG